MTCAETALQALVQYYVHDIPTARRTLECHRPDLYGVCLGCTTQLGPNRWPVEHAPWPCRLARAAGVACEQVSRRPVEALKPILQVKTNRPFLAAIERNATEVTAPMRAIPRNPSTAPGNTGRSTTHGRRTR